MFAFLTVAALFAGAFSMPTVNPTPALNPFNTFCTSLTFGSGTCLLVPILNNGACTTFSDSAFSVFNDNLGSADIVEGFVCTFFINENCVSFTESDSFVVETFEEEVITVTDPFVNLITSFSCDGI